MDLMIVKDVMREENGHAILTGPLLLKEFLRRSEVERLFGTQVFVSDEEGKRFLAKVKGISVSQAMSGAYQVSLAVACPICHGGIMLESLVTDSL